MVGGIEACPFFHYEVLAHHSSPLVSKKMAVEHEGPAIAADSGEFDQKIYFGPWGNKNRVFLGCQNEGYENAGINHRHPFFSRHSLGLGDRVS